MKQFNEIKRLQQLAGINEIKVNFPTQLSPKDLEQLEILTEYFGEGSSPEEGEPSDEDYNYENNFGDEDENDPRLMAFRYLTSEKRGRFYLKDFFGFRDPNTPENGYETIVIITNNNINVATNSISENETGLGWYTSDGEFHIN
jgi:hypothetical protein